jgi:hypothetical protein
MKTEWRHADHMSYYFNAETGRILGSIFRYANQNVVWIAKVEKNVIPYTNDNEVHLGHFISSESAKTMVEEYWNLQNRTLLE